MSSLQQRIPELDFKAILKAENVPEIVKTYIRERLTDEDTEIEAVSKGKSGKYLLIRKENYNRRHTGEY